MMETKGEIKKKRIAAKQKKRGMGRCEGKGCRILVVHCQYINSFKRINAQNSKE